MIVVSSKAAAWYQADPAAYYNSGSEFLLLGFSFFSWSMSKLTVSTLPAYAP
jgi:hypothetical protein